MLKYSLTWLLVAVSGILGAMAARVYLQSSSSNDLFEFGKDLPEILYLVEQAYVDDVTMDELMPGAYQGTLESLDENACYIPAGESADDLGQEVFLTTGLVVVKQNSYPYIMYVADGSPAAFACVEANNYIRGINTATTRTKSIHQIHKLLLSADDFTLGVLSPGKLDDLQIKVTINPWTPQPMSLEQTSAGPYLLALPYAYPGWAADFDKALAAVPSDARFVLDLRGNALGDLNMLNTLCSRLLPDGELAWWQDAKGLKYPLKNRAQRQFKGALFLLTDHTTSRAAEMFAAIAREQGQARLVGERTLGLPFWYETLTLQTGGQLRMSTRDLYLAEDTRLTGKGLRPHLAVKHPKSARLKSTELLNTALTLVVHDDGTEMGEEEKADAKELERTSEIEKTEVKEPEQEEAEEPEELEPEPAPA